MKNMRSITLLVLTIFFTTAINAQNSEYKLFEKSKQNSGFGALTFNMFEGKYIMIGGEGAAIFRNFYFGGFGHSGSIGNYTYPFGSIAYNVRRSSGGLMLGGISNRTQFFAVYTDIKLSWDSYIANPVGISTGLTEIEYQGFSVVPAVGAAIRPISWMQLRLGAAYRYSGYVDAAGLDNVPHSGVDFTFHLTFGNY